MTGPTLVDFDDALTRYDPVIGLEVHVELNTASKMFCACATTFGAEPNTQTCPVCLGLPGALPVMNAVAVESAIRIGLALNTSIAPWCRFARKNYFYPDMPKDFQTSQYDEPIAFDGSLDVDIDVGGATSSVSVGIERAHMEEDTGKSLHVGGSTGRIHGAEYSLVDYNRAGIPLIEIVTRPIEVAGPLVPQLARAYVSTLRDLILALGVSDAHMHQGSMRVDANVSLKPRGSATLGTRTETKNVNSLRSVERAVRYEIQRQAAVLDAGSVVVQETRHFAEGDGTTLPGRVKEEAEDYRYFPEPDLVPITPSAQWVEGLRATLPEAPSLRRKRLQAAWGVPDHEMAALVNAGALDVVEQTVRLGADPGSARKWWLGEVARRANETGKDIGDLPISASEVARVVALVEEGRLNDKMGRQVIEAVLDGEGSPDDVIARRGLEVVSDDAVLTAAIDEALAAAPDIAAKIAGGKTAAAGAIVGVVMRTTRGQADAARVRELILARYQS